MGHIDEIGEVEAGNPDVNAVVGDNAYFLVVFKDMTDLDAAVTVQMDKITNIELVGDALITIGLSMGGTL